MGVFADTETSTVKLLRQYDPYLFRFVLPVALLLFVYVKMEKYLEPDWMHSKDS